MSNKVFDDETILDGFKRLGDIIESQQQLNKLIDQRLKNCQIKNLHDRYNLELYGLV